MPRMSVPLGYRDVTSKQRRLQVKGNKQRIPSNIGTKSRPLSRENRGMRKSVIG